MVIDISKIDRDQFYVNEHIWNGELLYLVIPRQIGVKWNRDNLIFRSSVWNYLGEPVSLSYYKFFNYGEKPELSPIPKNLNNSVITTKIDGSTIIISKYKGTFIIRSRGTIDAYTLTTGNEMDILKQKYPKLFTLSTAETWEFSVITEYVSPNNQIVIKYNEIDFILTGLIYHNNYTLMSQYELDELAIKLNMKRPETYQFTTLDDLLDNVDRWIDKEGIVLYVNSQQQLKIKAAKYLFLHKMKSELSSIEKIIDVWISQNYPSYIDFYNYIVTTFDYELAEYCRGHMSNICDAWTQVKQIESGMTRFIDGIKNLPTRREQALKIISSYGGENNNRAGMLFTLLDNKPLTSDNYKRLIFQCLKK